MKKSFANHHEVAHVWAAQTQTEGRASNMFFDGPSIYSYGHHFEIARIVKPGVVFFNPKSYSNSTSKHQRRARSAVSHMQVFAVPSMTDHNENAAYLINELTDGLFGITRMRKNAEWALSTYASDAQVAMEYAGLFKKDIKAELRKGIMGIFKTRDNPLTPAQMEQFKKRALIEKEKAKLVNRARAKRAADVLIENQAHYDAWKAGTSDSLYNLSSFPTVLRLKDNVVETSRGANVPAIEARKLWHTLERGVDIRGQRVGHYTATGVIDGALVIGCHTIAMDEVKRMAIILGAAA